MERALFDDHLHAESDKILERYSIYGYWRPKPNISISGFARIGHTCLTGTPKRAVNAGASASLRPANWIRLSLNYQKNNMSTDDLPAQHYLFSTADLSLPNGHSMSFKIRWFEFEDNGMEDLSIYAAYTVPFSLPAMKKRSIGVLKGRVVGGEEAEFRPRANVLLTAGDYKAITDIEGKFTFPPLEPDTYSLRVDQRSIGLHETTTEPYPMTVHIIGGEETTKRIEVVLACEISGQVRLLEPDREKLDFPWQDGLREGSFLTGTGGAVDTLLSPDDWKIVSGYADIFVELSNGDTVLRQQTDQAGRFVFNNLHPGTWLLTAYEYGIPSYYKFEKDLFDLQLTAGESAELIINIIPQLRPIEFIDDGEIAEAIGQ